MPNQFSKYCSDYYKNGDPFLYIKYKYLCPCAKDPEIYPSIKDNYRKEYAIAKQIIVKKQEQQRQDFVNYVAHYNYAANCKNNRQLRRGVPNADVQNIYKLFSHVANNSSGSI